MTALKEELVQASATIKLGEWISVHAGRCNWEVPLI